MKSRCSGCERVYQPMMLYDGCPMSAISDEFEVPVGYFARVKIIDIPDGWCIGLEEQLVWCCSTVEFTPVYDECKCLLRWCSDICDEYVCLPSGVYRSLITDGDGDPVVPHRGDVKIKIQVERGQCPTTSQTRT